MEKQFFIQATQSQVVDVLYEMIKNVEENAVLQSTRLFYVMKLAEIITENIIEAIRRKNS